MLRGGYSFNSINILNKLDIKYNFEISSHNPKVRKFVLEYVSNFLNLLNNPRDFRRCSSIHSGSFFSEEIFLTTVLLIPGSALKRCLSAFLCPKVSRFIFLVISQSFSFQGLGGSQNIYFQLQDPVFYATCIQYPSFAVNL